MVETRTTLENAAVLDVVAGKLLPRRRVVIAGGKIERIEPSGARTPAAGQVIDVGGLTVMPGLCDAHVHVTAWTANLAKLERTSPSYTAARAGEILAAMLMRGFTTVRDGGGADYGLVQAIAEGCFKGPRVLFCGRALSQTGGHGDMRRPGEEVVVGSAAGLGRCCDGEAEVRRACRDEIRKGANHIKLMLSGGVTSPTDRVGNAQFSEDEIRAAVDEAAMAGLYCMGHVYTARAANRALRCGVRSLEHCNLIDESTAALFVKHKAFMVPTLVTYVALTEDDRRAPADQKAKLDEVKDAGQAALALAYRRGVKLAYGTDLLGGAHSEQLREFALRARVQKPIDVIRSATCTAAELFCEEGRTGVVAAGARADLLVVDGDPLRDLGCLQDPARRLKAIIKGGFFCKNTLGRTGQR
jgi:imidazolonepropionase-like amidohydrolase